MADQKISELTALTGANVADDDAIAIVDTSATETKKIVFSELKNALDTATGFVRITGDTMTGALTINSNLSVDGGTIKLDGNYPTGTNNVALGNAAFDSVTTGDQNVAIGASALTATTDGRNNTAIGEEALAASTSDNNNTAVGKQSMTATDGGTLNAAFGSDTMKANTTGDNNVAVGAEALFSSTTASNNTAVGYQAGYSKTTAPESTMVGYQAGYSETTGGYNAFFGMKAGYAVTTGQENTFVGRFSGSSITTGGKNSILGKFSGNQGGLDIRTSSNNIVLSDGDGNPRVYVDGSGNMGVGTVSVGGTIHGQNSSTTLSPFYGVTSSASYTGNMFKSLSFTAAGTGWNHFIGYGSIGGTTDIKIIGNGNLVNTNNSYGAISDLKLKENIVDSGSQWDDIKALTVRKYSMKVDNLDAPNMLGVIAQEVEAAGMGGLVYETPDRDIDDNDLGTVTKQVNYSILYMKAVKALQEAMDRIETLEAKVTALENA
jgi:hypothetical protein